MMMGTSGRRLRSLAATSVPNLAGAEVVVENGDVDLVEELGGFFGGGGRERGVAVLTQNGAAKMQIDRIVVEQQNRHARRADEFEAGR